VIDAFTLAEGRMPPALSLYVRMDADGRRVGERSAIERVPVAANLRLDTLGEAFASDAGASREPAWTAELRALWKLATSLAAARGKADIPRVDYNFDVDWSVADGTEPGWVTITPRPRGNPLDRLVAELMIHVNHTWGKLIAERRLPGLYRVQSGGKVKMSTRPGEHQGLGLTHYLWASSPLRRYSDLVNQRQLLAIVRGERAPYGDNDAELYAALADFEATYSQYAEMQDRMEHYWCLRWLLQERASQCMASVIRETLVRFERLPLVIRLPDMPASAPDTPVRVAIGRIDLLDCTLECRYAGLGG
jgi:exoribonuclease-2